MCGICGIYHFHQENQVQSSDLHRMMRRMIHRGPDDSGEFTYPGCGLGVRRLSIIDPAHGHQPATEETGQIIAALNGEIYNYPELRQKLIARGHRFRSNSDTEILPHLYEEHHREMASLLEGMFALAIYDCTKHELFIARDRFGMKPLFFFQDSERFIFASEKKAILELLGSSPRLAIPALVRFFTFEFIPAPDSAYTDISKLLPAETLFINNKQITKRFFWQLELKTAPPQEDPPKLIYSLLDSSVRSHSLSDVPIGLCLSGGVDSSAVLSHMSRQQPRSIDTFTITFDNPAFNEAPMAQMIATFLGAVPHFECCDPLKMLPELETILSCVDEPFGDASLIPTYLLARLASRSVKVVLSGEGGDEVLGGYLTYQAHLIAQRLRSLPTPIQELLKKIILSFPARGSHLSRLFKLSKLFRHFQKPPEVGNTLFWGAFDRDELNSIVRKDYAEHLTEDSLYKPIHSWLKHCPYQSGLERIFFLDLKLYLQDGLLMKVDHAAMANSLEVRLPYLDRAIVENMMAIPAHRKVSLLKVKRILRTAYRSILPEAILRQPKHGFDLPLDDWIRGPWHDFVQDHLAPILADQDSLLEGAEVKRILQQHLTHACNNRQKLWTILCYAIWRNSLS